MSHFPLPWTFTLHEIYGGNIPYKNWGEGILWKNLWILPVCVDRIYSPKRIGPFKRQIQTTNPRWYCWWFRKSCTSWYWEYPMVSLNFMYNRWWSPGFLEPSTVLLQKVLFWLDNRGTAIHSKVRPHRWLWGIASKGRQDDSERLSWAVGCGSCSIYSCWYCIYLQWW